MRRIPHNFERLLVLTCLVIFCLGCASTDKKLARKNDKETMQALEAVASTYTHEQMTEEEMRQAAEDIQSDEEARSAIKAIADSYEGKQTNIKYSPVTGKRYSGDLEYDPETGAKLVPLKP